jgi:glycosyltransferase involved in cell wall biosynthesis
MVTLVIPAYNEEKRIGRMLTEYLSELPEVRFLVVLNNCSDQSQQVVEDLQRQHPGKIDLLNIPAAIGKGGAILRGWKDTASELIGFVDADGATSAQEFKKLIAAIEQHDGAIASRFLPGAHILERKSWIRKLTSQAVPRLVRWLFGLPYSDTQCGAKLFKRATIIAVLPKLRTTNMLFDIELLWALHLRGCDVIEVPTVWVDQPGSASLGSNAKFVRTAFGLLWHLFRLRRHKQYYAAA